MTVNLTRARDAATTLADSVAHLVPGIAQRQRLLGMGAVEATAEGADVYLSNGSTVLDFGNYAVSLFGHRPRHVVDAVREGLDAMPVSTRLLANPQPAELAAKLANTVDPGRLTRVWLGLNGSDAVEAALKLAVARTGRSSILAVERGFHGKTMGALAATFDPERRRAVSGFLGPVRHIPLVGDAVARAAMDEPFAALIVEPVQGEGGGRVIPTHLLRRWSADAHAAGAVVIADEIQCGLGRCGPLSLAIEAGMEPDAVLFGKPLGGGVMPLSAAVMTEDLFTPLKADPYFHTATFGGYPLSCAAGVAALELRDMLADEFPVAGAALTALTRAVASVGRRSRAVVVNAHSTGLFGVIEFATPAQAELALVESARRGLLLAQCLTAPNVLRILPPVVTTSQQWDHATTVLLAACKAVERKTVR